MHNVRYRSDIEKQRCACECLLHLLLTLTLERREDKREHNMNPLKSKKFLEQ